MIKVFTLLLFILSPLTYSCGSVVIKEGKKLLKFQSIMVMAGVPADIDRGKAEALISIDKSGYVVKAQLMSVTPESLDREKILKEIKKARFSTSSDREEYIRTFEFQVLHH